MKLKWIRLVILFLLIIFAEGCSQIGYVPLSDVEVDAGVDKQHSESKKFLKKNIRPINSQLPGSEKFMKKGIRKEPSQLPGSKKLFTMKKQSSRRERKAYEKKVAKQNWFKWPPGGN